FTFRASDGTVDSNVATVSLTVTSVNGVPLAQSRSADVNEDASVAVTLVATDSDGDTLTFTVVSGPAHGTLSGTAPHLTYAPAPNFHGSDSFTFRASDGTADSSVAPVTLTVAPVNDAPQAQETLVTTPQNTPVQVVLAGTDVDGDTLSYLETQPSHGMLSGTPPNLTYTPADGYAGEDSFTYRVSDGTAASESTTVSITVTPSGGCGGCASTNGGAWLPWALALLGITLTRRGRIQYG
ncbi:Ig-like domain-containing protein, partial [Hyalangium sp.]|uniref:Ig-like domain-containing protein n=1 Tax=Hyalangium sp. TaxID=2028555 RepID=UPI002D6C06E8